MGWGNHVTQTFWMNSSSIWHWVVDQRASNIQICYVMPLSGLPCYIIFWFAILYLSLYCIFISMSALQCYTYFWSSFYTYFWFFHNWFKAYYTYFWLTLLYLHLLCLILLVPNMISGMLYLRPVWKKRILYHRPLYLLMAPRRESNAETEPF